MDEDKIKIAILDNKIITVKELYEGKEKTRKLMAKIPFPEKIKALVSLQEIAYTWGNKKDVIIWRIDGER